MEPERARKVVAGFRPVRIVGVEIQYIDFDDTGLGARGTLLRGGSRQGGPAVYDQASFMKAGAEAWLLSALLFIPEQLPLVDVYGKVGVADLAESFTAIATTVECVPLSQCTNRIYSDVHESNVGPYIGIGARFELAPAVAVRAEYEAIDRDVGDPAAMLSLGFAWEH
jgi:opacity protein-like surface antigen